MVISVSDGITGARKIELGLQFTKYSSGDFLVWGIVLLILGPTSTK